tara:strand:+ start:5004 stop:5294 length:291 start_codon:yes stop_codon:yes gene_type:complete
MQDIIDPVVKQRLITENAEKVYFEDLRERIIQKIAEQWKSHNTVYEKIENKYYNFEYTIEDCYNQSGNRTLLFLNSRKKIHDYNYMNITNILKKIL